MPTPDYQEIPTIATGNQSRRVRLLKSSASRIGQGVQLHRLQWRFEMATRLTSLPACKPPFLFIFTYFFRLCISDCFHFFVS